MSDLENTIFEKIPVPEQRSMEDILENSTGTGEVHYELGEINKAMEREGKTEGFIDVDQIVAKWENDNAHLLN